MTRCGCCGWAALSLCQLGSKFGKLGSGYRTGKVSFHSNFQKKNLLVKVKEESERADLKLNIKKTKIMASVVTQG